MAESENDVLLEPRPLTASTRRKVEKKLASLHLKLDGTALDEEEAPRDGAKTSSGSEISREISVDDLAFALKEDMNAQKSEVSARRTEVEDGASEMPTELEFGNSHSMETDLEDAEVVQVCANVGKAEKPASTLSEAIDGNEAIETASESTKGHIGSILECVSEAKPSVAEQTARATTSDMSIHDERQETIQYIPLEPRDQSRQQESTEIPRSRPTTKTGSTEMVKAKTRNLGDAESRIPKTTRGEAGRQSTGAAGLREVDPNLSDRVRKIQGQTAGGTEGMAVDQVSEDALRSRSPTDPRTDGANVQIMGEAPTAALPRTEEVPQLQSHQETPTREESIDKAKLSQEKKAQMMQRPLQPIQDAVNEMAGKRKPQAEDEPKQVAGTEDLISIQTRLAGKLDRV